MIYQSEKGDVELHVDINEDTIWAPEARIAELFDTTHQNVNLHLKNIYNDGELLEKATRKESLLVQKEGGKSVKRSIILYNLDAIIAVGYRVSSKKATQFRIWATKTLREYLVRGYSLNKYSLEKTPKALLDLYAAMSTIESKTLDGKLRGKITFKMTQDLDLS